MEKELEQVLNIFTDAEIVEEFNGFGQPIKTIKCDNGLIHIAFILCEYCVRIHCTQENGYIYLHRTDNFIKIINVLESIKELEE